VIKWGIQTPRKKEGKYCGEIETAGGELHLCCTAKILLYCGAIGHTFPSTFMEWESQQYGANPWEIAENKTQNRVQDKFTRVSVFPKLCRNPCRENPSTACGARVTGAPLAPYDTQHLAFSCIFFAKPSYSPTPKSAGNFSRLVINTAITPLFPLPRPSRHRMQQTTTCFAGCGDWC